MGRALVQHRIRGSWYVQAATSPLTPEGRIIKSALGGWQEPRLYGGDTLASKGLLETDGAMVTKLPRPHSAGKLTR